MTGVEVAGLALGILPLLISAVENYEVTFQPFITYCRYDKELRDFRTVFATQKGLFESHCLVLLSKVEADWVLEEPSRRLECLKQNEEAKAADIRIWDYLGRNAKTCVPIIELIDRTVLSIANETACLREAASQDLPSGTKARSKAMRKKIKFSVSKPRLKAKVDDLRQQNGDFLALIESIERLQNVHTKKSSASEAGLRQSMKDFNFVQTASQRVFEALASIWTCSVHSGHSANICLDRTFDSSVSCAATIDPMPRIRFDVAFDCQTWPLPLPLPSTVWLEIETSAGVRQGQRLDPATVVTQDSGEASFKDPLKRMGSHLFSDASIQKVCNPRKRNKTVSFLLPSANEDTEMDEVLTADEPVKLENNDLPELCSKQDLCLHLQQTHQDAEACDTSICVGVLKKTETFKHIVYQRRAGSKVTESISLETVISGISESNPIDGISSLERVQLALSLAKSVLHFNASAWLPESWRSHNVHFYCINSETLHQPGCLSTPFLNIQLPTTPLRGDRSDDVAKPNLLLSPIRNNVLFGFGIILLELGFESPMSRLHSEDELASGQEHHFSDYITAKRLKHKIGRPLGPRYGKIARKCLDCEFNSIDHDLQDPTLQAAFYKDVILELVELEKVFKKLEL